MRLAFRFLLAHVLASFGLQLLFIAWVEIAGEKLNPVRALMATWFAPILVPLPILGIGRKMRAVGYVLYGLLYLTLLAVVFLLLTWRARRRQRCRRIKNGLCIKCGYDVRGSADRCPECGAISEQESPAAAE